MKNGGMIGLRFRNRLFFLRVMLIGSALLILLSSISRYVMHPDYYDPVWLRLALAGIVLLCVLVSYLGRRLAMLAEAMAHLALRRFSPGPWRCWPSTIAFELCPDQPRDSAHSQYGFR